MEALKILFQPQIPSWDPYLISFILNVSHHLKISHKFFKKLWPVTCGFRVVGKGACLYISSFNMRVSLVYRKIIFCQETNENLGINESTKSATLLIKVHICASYFSFWHNIGQISTSLFSNQIADGIIFLAAMNLRPPRKRFPWQYYVGYSSEAAVHPMYR